MANDYKEVSNALRSLRHSKGYTLSEVAKQTGLTVQTISKYENHPERLTIEKLTKLLSSYGVDTGEFLRTFGGIFFNSELESNEN